jgi:hypothetical protein
MLAPHIDSGLAFNEGRVMDDERTNRSALKPPRCLGCARPMQLLRRTSRFGGLPDLHSFYCLACDEWHVEEGDVPIG